MRLAAKPRPRMTREERREAILECATRRFASHGYQEATVADIAGELGVTEPLVYKHFASKEELFRAVFQRVTRYFVERVLTITAESQPPLEALRRIARSYYEALDEHPEFAAILYQVSAHGEGGQERFREALGFLKRIFLDLVVELVREAKRRGEIPEAVDELAAAWMFIGNYHVLILLKSFELDEFDEHTLEAMFDLVTGRAGRS